MIGILGFLAFSMLAIAGAFDGEIAMPATPLLIRSSTIWTSPASSALDAGPVYRQVYSDLGFSLFHSAQPSPSTVKNGLSRPLTTTANVFFWAQLGPAASSAASATPTTFSIALFIAAPVHRALRGLRMFCCRLRPCVLRRRLCRRNPPRDYE